MRKINCKSYYIASHSHSLPNPFIFPWRENWCWVSNYYRSDELIYFHGHSSVLLPCEVSSGWHRWQTKERAVLLKGPEHWCLWTHQIKMRVNDTTNWHSLEIGSLWFCVRARRKLLSVTATSVKKKEYFHLPFQSNMVEFLHLIGGRALWSPLMF